MYTSILVLHISKISDNRHILNYLTYYNCPALLLTPGSPRNQFPYTVLRERLPDCSVTFQKECSRDYGHLSKCMIDSWCRRRNGPQWDTCGLVRWIQEVPVDRVVDCRRVIVVWRGRRAEGDKTRGLELGEGGEISRDHFRSTKRTRTLHEHVSTVDSLIVHIVHAKLTDARSTAASKTEHAALFPSQRDDRCIPRGSESSCARNLQTLLQTLIKLGGCSLQFSMVS